MSTSVYVKSSLCSNEIHIHHMYLRHSRKTAFIAVFPFPLFKRTTQCELLDALQHCISRLTLYCKSSTCKCVYVCVCMFSCVCELSGALYSQCFQHMPQRCTNGKSINNTRVKTFQPFTNFHMDSERHTDLCNYLKSANTFSDKILLMSLTGTNNEKIS